MNIQYRKRLFGLAGFCAVALSLTGCVAYDGGGYYAPAYADGGYYGGYYGGGYETGSVNVFIPGRDRDDYRHSRRVYERRDYGHRDYDRGQYQRPSYGGGNWGGNHWNRGYQQPSSGG